MLRSAVDGQVFRTAHRSQTVYHGAVISPDDPQRRLKSVVGPGTLVGHADGWGSQSVLMPIAMGICT